MAKDIPATIAAARGFLTSHAYGAEERVTLLAIIDHLEKARAALKPFATARMDAEDGEKIADWHEQHDSEGVSLIWDPEAERECTLSVGQFKRARAAYLGES